MSGQSSGSSAPSASAVPPNAKETQNLRLVPPRRESGSEAAVTTNLTQDEPLQRRHRPRGSGGFLLQTSLAPAAESRLSPYTESDTTRDVKGKRKAEEGDINLPKRASAHQRHRQKLSLGSSPLATEVASVNSWEHTNQNEASERDKRSSIRSTNRQTIRSSLNSNHTFAGSATGTDSALLPNGNNIAGHDTDPVQIVNLALSLSEGRRRNFSSGGLLIPREVIGARRIISSGHQTLGLPDSGSGPSLRQHLHQQRHMSQHIFPRSGRSTSNKGSRSASLPSHDKQLGDEQPTLVPGYDTGVGDDVIFDASDATYSRAEKARVAIELMYEYRRLLQYLPALPQNPKSKPVMKKGAAKHEIEPSTGLGRPYNPLQYIRNRKVRFRERRSLDAEAAGWKDIDRVRIWVDTVASEREDGVSSIDQHFPLPSLDTVNEQHYLADGLQNPSVPLSAGSQNRKVGRPRMDWEFTSWDLLADAHWLNQDDNLDHIEDPSGKKITAGHLHRKDHTPRASFESNRNSMRRSESIVREHASPDRVRALAGHSRKDSKDRGRRSLDTYEQGSPLSEDNHSRDRKSRWRKKLVRGRSSSDSEDSHRERHSNHRRGHHDLESAALEKQMMDMLAKEVEASHPLDQIPVEDTDAKTEPDLKPHGDGTGDRDGKQGAKSRPGTPKRTRTDIPVTERHQISARASLDEERLRYHRMPSDDLDLTAPNSPTVPRFVPSIAINLSPPASPPSAVDPPEKTMTSRMGASRRDRSSSINRQATGEDDQDSSGTTDLSRQTTSESQLVYMLRKENPKGPINGLFTSLKSEAAVNKYRTLDGNSIRSIKNVNGSDSRLRGLFKGGRIAELVGSEVSRVGDMFWKKDNTYASRVTSPASSYAASEESDVDDGDMVGSDSSPKNNLSRATTKDGGSLSKVSTNSEKPRYYMSNLPSFRSSFNRDEQSLKSTKGSPDHDHITRQQLAQRERGRSTRFDRLAPPKIDMRRISPPSREPSPVPSQTRGTHDRDSRRSSSSQSDRRVRTADRRLNAMLGVPGKAGTGRAPPTGLAGLESQPRGSSRRPALKGKRQWSISDQGVSTIRGTVNERDVARVRALLLSSGVKANEIARRAEEVPEKPANFLQELEGMFKGPIPHVSRSQEPLLAARMLISNIEIATQRLRDDAEQFTHTTIQDLHDQIKSMDEHVTHKLTPLVRASADDADAFSTELATTHTLAVKQLNDTVNTILRRRRRRLRYLRRIGWATVEWTLLGIMWIIWLVVVVVRLVRGIVGGLVQGLRWLFWL